MAFKNKPFVSRVKSKKEMTKESFRTAKEAGRIFNQPQANLNVFHDS